MTVVAELGGEKVKCLERLCPSIDILGINSYAGGPSIPQRYKDLGGTKPYLLTEFGPAGTWETPKTDWGAPIEPTSTEKAVSYRKTWTDAIANQPMSLGGFAFTWGNKQEATATWFGMLLPNGCQDACRGRHDRALDGESPRRSLPDRLSAPGFRRGGGRARRDGFGDTDGERPGRQASFGEVGSLRRQRERQRWVATPRPCRRPSPTLSRKPRTTGATVTLPKAPGAYRLFAYVTDPAGNSSIANVPLLVKGAVAGPKGTGAKLPFTVYAEKGEKPTYVPTGWMGNTRPRSNSTKAGRRTRTPVRPASRSRSAPRPTGLASCGSRRPATGATRPAAST